jgi:4-carboxymuconolactone decarboxylase
MQRWQERYSDKLVTAPEALQVIRPGQTVVIGMHGNIPAALNVGFSQAEVVEILMHTAPYSGFPRALHAVALAQEILGK